MGLLDRWGGLVLPSSGAARRSADTVCGSRPIAPLAGRQRDILLSRFCLDGGDRSPQLQCHNRKRDVPANQLLEKPELAFVPWSPTAHRHAASSTEGNTSGQDPQSIQVSGKNTAGFATVTAVFVSPAWGEPFKAGSNLSIALSAPWLSPGKRKCRCARPGRRSLQDRSRRSCGSPESVRGLQALPFY